LAAIDAAYALHDMAACPAQGEREPLAGLAKAIAEWSSRAAMTGAGSGRCPAEPTRQGPLS